MRLFCSILALAILVNSCGTSNSVTSNHFLQKRKHTNGWHLNTAQKKFTSNKASTYENITTDASINSTIYSEKSNSNLIELRSVEQLECDTIILNDGKIVRGTILNTTDSTIIYIDCEGNDSTEFTMNKKDVKALQFADGKFEFIKHQSAKEVHNKEQAILKEEKEARQKKNRRGLSPTSSNY